MSDVNRWARAKTFLVLCKATVLTKKLHDAAVTSFMKKCERDSKTACDSQATEKELAGAAKTSFTRMRAEIVYWCDLEYYFLCRAYVG